MEIIEILVDFIGTLIVKVSCKLSTTTLAALYLVLAEVLNYLLYLIPASISPHCPDPSVCAYS